MVKTMRGSEAERFWAKVADTSNPSVCWQWIAGGDKGYGRFYISEAKGRVLAHRWAYEALVGPIPAGLDLDHLCRNPGCVNPAHLEPVTKRVNTLRGLGYAAENARKTTCPDGHVYDYVEPSTGKRRCRACTARRRARRRNQQGAVR